MTFLPQDSSRSVTLRGEKSVSGSPAPEAGDRAPVLPEECRHCWSRSHTTPSPPGLGRKATLATASHTEHHSRGCSEAAE